ncbi:uncharacterized protein LOC110723496 [Chenopodium quinoa]|uniref:uncharacterized protein LOC110723496 n=1 Tax=Chenopodium quinoa TaxID=63459 RepID=UPI000B77E6F6|nr:uncharacterized protein LOC110723496 [Chenopodium quinoa]
MNDEYSALIKTGTWDLVPRHAGVNIVNCMWLFKHKYKFNGDLERHKTRLETVYMHQPPGFVDRRAPSHVCRLRKALYVTRKPSYLLLSQEKYAQEILERAGMASCKPAATPVDTKSKLSADAGPPFRDYTLYRSLAGALQYLTFTRYFLCSTTGVSLYA